MIKSSASVTSEQSVMFADWAAELGHTTPDRVMTERHVSSMVEVSAPDYKDLCFHHTILKCFAAVGHHFL